MHTKALVIAASLAITAHARAAPPAAHGDSGLRLGARLGVALPLGDIVENAGLNDSVSVSLPIGLDAAYRFNSYFSAGVYFTYGFGFTKNCPTGATCSAHTIHLGAEAFYHFLPRALLDPYVGLGTGWEWLSLGGTVGGQSGDLSFNGWEFLTFHAGGDFRVASRLAVGPYLAFSLGRYSSCGASLNGVDQACTIVNGAMHEWFQIGIRGSFDF